MLEFYSKNRRFFSSTHLKYAVNDFEHRKKRPILYLLPAEFVLRTAKQFQAIIKSKNVRMVDKKGGNNRKKTHIFLQNTFYFQSINTN